MPSLNYPAMPRTVYELGFEVAWLPVKAPHLHPELEKLDPGILKKAVALVWPHYFGFPGPMEELEKFCQENRIDLLEDCAHALGTTYKGKCAGSFGRASFISFETSKIMNTFGGGIALVNETLLVEKLRQTLELLPPRPPMEIYRGIAKSYFEKILTDRWVYTLLLYPLIYRSKSLGRKDFLEEGLSKPAPGKLSRYSPLQAVQGIRHMDCFVETLEKLRTRFRRIQACLEDAGLAVPVGRGAEPNGYLTAGLHNDAPGIASDFIRHGIDIKLRYMQDCRALGFGCGPEQTDNPAPVLFHIPNPADISDRCFDRYVATIRKVLEKTS